MASSVSATVAWPPPSDTWRGRQLAERKVQFRPPLPPPSTSPLSPATSSRMFAVLVVIPIRLFLAAGWLRAGVEKLIEGKWWNGDSLRAFLTEHSTTALPFFRPVMDHLVEPLAISVAFVVMATEIACGIAIAIGRPLRAAVRWGLLLNIIFILCGQVNPSAFYAVMEMTLLFALAEGVIGRQPTRPTWRTAALAGLCFVIGVCMMPYVRTLQPALVIADPAIMLTFLAVMMAATLVLRCCFATPRAQSTSRFGLWSNRIAAWAVARPEPTSVVQESVVQESAVQESVVVRQSVDDRVRAARQDRHVAGLPAPAVTTFAAQPQLPQPQFASRRMMESALIDKSMPSPHSARHA